VSGDKNLTAMSNISVFVNVPYGAEMSDLVIAYIAGLTSLGLVPRFTAELPIGARLDRIVELIRSCRYSVHDLSYVQLDKGQPRTPRFNMPFELGMTVAWAETS